MSRGPSYPFVDLEEAIQTTRKIYEFAKRSTAPTDSVVQQALGYSLKSSGGQKTVAALRSYGLIEETSSTVKVSDRAYRILMDTADSPERKQAIRDAALSPKWYETVYTNWGVDPPASARSTLVLNHSFVPTTVDAFLKGFRRTMQFAEISNTDVQVEEAREQRQDGSSAVKIGSFVQWESGGVLRMPEAKKLANLSEDGKWAFVEGSPTGIPIGEIIPAERPEAPVAIGAHTRTTETVPTNNGPKNLAETFTLASGIACQLQWPSALSSEEYEDFVYQLEGLKRKVNRAVGKSDG